MACPDCDRHQHMWDIVINEQRYTPQPGHLVLDLGMWCGHFSFYCASRGAIVKAYEPMTDVFNETQQVLKKEPWCGSVNALNRAVGSADGVRSFLIDPANVRSSRLQEGGDLLVPTDSLATAMGDTSWDCVKVDIEGGEYEVFAKAPPELLERIKYLTMEMHNDVLTKEQHDELLKNLTKNFPDVELVEQFSNGLPLGKICKGFFRR